MKRLGFVDLCVDVKKMILDYITRSTDLKSICLACKDLQTLAIPRLYKVVRLFLGGDQDIRIVNSLTGTLFGKNPGLPYIREIYVHLAPLPAVKVHEGEMDILTTAALRAQDLVSLILERLPPNTLESFLWHITEPCSVATLLLLWQNQKSLKILYLLPAGQPLLPEIEKHPNIFRDMPNLQSLNMFPDTVDMLQTCGKILCDSANIQELSLLNGSDFSNETVEDLYDSCTHPGLCTRMIFHILPYWDLCRPLELKRFTLEGIDLQGTPCTWIKTINFTTLTQLELFDCPQAYILFDQLSRPELRSSGLKMICWHYFGKVETQALESFERFLSAFSGLEAIRIDLRRVEALPKVSSFLNHQKSLTFLAIHCESHFSNAFTYTENELSAICQHCTRIRQLSLMFPETRIPPLMTTEPSVKKKLSPAFSGFLTHIYKLKSLTTLNIRSWPLGFTSAQQIDNLLPFLHFELQSIAQGIFESSDGVAKYEGFGFGNRSGLSVIAWGGSNYPGQDRNVKIDLKTVPFLRGVQIDPFGQTSVLAYLTKWQLIKYVEPESDILDYGNYDDLYDH